MSTDTQDMREATAALPERVFDAAQSARGLEGLPSRESIEHVVVLGMGGSGVAGDILLAAAAPFMAVPVVVVKGYELPHFVGEGSLVFVVSFSGDTEETIETGTEAALQGARIVAITGGGEIAKRAAGWGAPVVGVPTNIPQPRVGLGSLAIPPLVVLEEIGLFPGASQWIDLAVDQLRRRRDALVVDGNEAEALARRIGRTFPIIYGGGALGSAAAQRWKTQINENAKSPAFWNTHPELCHNELSAWGQHGDVTRQVLTLINLRHDHEHPQVSRRFDLTTELVRETVASVEEVRAQGDGELAQLLDLILFGDFVALHLALQEGVDPGPVAVQEDLKAALSAG
ncbi:MAG: glucose/mannose-6-phosphate isomerase [Actinomycetota bacterium]|jgi:glucose/mannose-6-phosphate isomerase